MGALWIDRVAELPDGFQSAHDGPEIQQLSVQTQYAQVAADYPGCNQCCVVQMDGCTPYFHHLYSFIFALQKQTCMTYSVHINVMPLKDLLDPQGKAVLGGLGNMGLNAIEDVRVGKHITLQVNADSPEQAKAIAEEASKKLLANPVMEFYEIEMIN